MSDKTKTTPWNASDDSAKKQLKIFLLAGWILTIVAMVIFGFLAFIALAFGARCIILSWHKANSARLNGVWLKVASIALVVVSGLQLLILYFLK